MKSFERFMKRVRTVLRRRDLNSFTSAAVTFAKSVDIKRSAVVGIPITALVPEIGLAIDICCSKKIITIKEYVC